MVPDSADRRPVVLILIKGLGIGGAEKLISEGARFWDRSSFDYCVAYFLPWKNQLVGQLEAMSVPTRCIGSRGGLTPGILSRFRRLLNEWRVNLVHAHLPTAGILARIASGVPVVYTEHNLVWSYRPVTRFLNRLTYRRNAAVTAVSGAVAETIARYPGPAHSVITNGVSVAVDSGERTRVRQELGMREDEALVVHVGNIRPGKGHEVLVEATALLRNRETAPRVVSIGVEKKPGDIEHLRDMVSERGLDGQVQFLGRRPDALAFIAAADVYVNPAEVEGLPVTVLEAMALARPVVATAVGGVPGLIRNGHTGLTVEPGKPDLLADAIAKVLDHPAEAQQMGQAAARLVEAEHGLEPMVRAFENIYWRTLA